MAIPPKSVSSRSDSKLALENDWKELKEKFDPAVVMFSKKDAPAPGLMARLTVTVKAPSHYLTTVNDMTPKACSEMAFFIDVFNGYPRTKVKVYYPAGKRLASVNVFPNGIHCTNDWLPYSSIITVTEKVVRDIIHDPIVANFNSMTGQSGLATWQRQGASKGMFPTIPLARLYRRQPQQTAPACRGAPPPMPAAVRRPRPAAQARRVPPPLPRQH